MINIREYLKNNDLILDGAFGTYYADKFDTDELPEKANTYFPKRVETIHREYLDAGAKLIRTNTFATNQTSFPGDFSYVEQNLRNACSIARKVCEDRAYIAGDIGQIDYDRSGDNSEIIAQYIRICKVFIEEKADVICFETFADMDDIIQAIDYVRENSDIFVMVSFAVNQFGYSSQGLSMRKLFSLAEKSGVDAYGLNCGIGPSHMVSLMKDFSFSTNKHIVACPNSGYSERVSSRTFFGSSSEKYFCGRLGEIAGIKANIVGGCCGTTPDYIKRLSKTAFLEKNGRKEVKILSVESDVKPDTNSFYNNKNGKLIAVELAPPFDINDEKLIDAAHLLKAEGVDVLTFPDSPSGRTRIDPILMAAKVLKETDMCVMPHLCCRDKNAIAIRSSLMGAYINGIDNFLVITGDPVPSNARQTVKAVFNCNSVGFMNIINDMNEEVFKDRNVTFGGAINQNRLNLSVEIDRVKRKMEAGATFFLTQPVFDINSINNLRHIKEETNARILVGIMPLVSHRNALFMKNEMAGICVPDEIIERYPVNGTREEGEAVGVSIAREMMRLCEDFCDGYYFSFPFNRVSMLKRIRKGL